MDSLSKSEKEESIEFVCPLCHADLILSSDKLICSCCSASYKVVDGVCDFRQLLKSGDWDSEIFDQLYKVAESGVEDNFKHAENSGIPRFAEEYRYSRNGAVVEKLICDLKPAAVLDAGCGCGWFSFKLQEAMGETFFAGVDISPFKISCFQKKNVAVNGNMKPTLANAGVLPFTDESFDVVLLREVIEHLPDPEKAISEFARVLKPHGTLIITTPSRFMTKFWKFVAYIPTKIKRIVKREELNRDNKHVYDKPLCSNRLKGYVRGYSFEVVKWNKVILLPHESYLQYIPGFLIRIIIKIAGLLEFLRVNIIGLHHLIVLKKR
jgi:ubiquinone/menaquinone biosynthesis C-methylase UbiE